MLHPLPLPAPELVLTERDGMPGSDHDGVLADLEIVPLPEPGA